MARPERFELPTTWFEARYSIQLSYGRIVSHCYQSFLTVCSLILQPYVFSLLVEGTFHGAKSLSRLHALAIQLSYGRIVSHCYQSFLTVCSLILQPYVFSLLVEGTFHGAKSLSRLHALAIQLSYGRIDCFF